MEYRREIDGLRALAVLPVMLFHAGFQTFSGGFVGVDVFFVISGYLITSIILAEREAGTFTVMRFYERRARRILPALFVVMFACIVCGWIYLLPGEMKVFGQGISASAAFAANVFFYIKNNDYFGMQSDENPILHLWSLAVEEQYYVLFPIFLIVAWRYGRHRIFAMLVVVAAASLALAQWGTMSDPSAAFFLLPARGWELLAGSLIAFKIKDLDLRSRSPATNEWLSATGIVLIVFSIFYFDRTTPFPGFWALLPTIGTSLVILYSTPDTFSYKVLGSRVLVGVGLISFSAYLWHQPLFAFNRILNYEEPRALSFAFLLLVALGLAYLTWRFVEKPFRQRDRFGRGSIFALSAAGIAAFLVFGVVGHFNSGYPDRDPLYKRLLSNFGLSLECNGNYVISPTCSTSDRPEVAVFGNSYAMHLVEGFRTAFPQKGLVQLTQDSCQPHGANQYAQAGKRPCSEFYKLAMSTILDTPTIKVVVISSPFKDLAEDRNLAAFDATITALKSAHKRILVVGPTPSSGTDFGKCFVAHRNSADLGVCHFRRSDIDPHYFKTVSRLESLARKHGFEFLNLTDLICDSTTCNTSVGDSIIYRDKGHLSREGSRYIFRKFAERGVLALANQHQAPAHARAQSVIPAPGL